MLIIMTKMKIKNIYFPKLFLEYFCAVTAEDIQKKVAMGTGKKRHAKHGHRLLVERVADRFNQVRWMDVRTH